MWQKKSNLDRLHKEFQMNEQKIIPSWGHSIIKHIGKTAGQVQETPALCLHYKEEVSGRVVMIKDSPYKMLFSVGLFALDRVEFGIVLPSDWPLLRYCVRTPTVDTLPADILIELSNKLARKTFRSGSIAEGFVIDKTKTPWNKLAWPNDLQGFIVVDVSWGDAKRDYSVPYGENDVAIYTLFPVYEKMPSVKDTLAWAQARHFATWDDMQVQMPAPLALPIKMSQAIDAQNIPQIKSLLEQGASLNENDWYFHSSFGWVQEEKTLLSDKLNDTGLNLQQSTT